MEKQSRRAEPPRGVRVTTPGARGAPGPARDGPFPHRGESRGAEDENELPPVEGTSEGERTQTRPGAGSRRLRRRHPYRAPPSGCADRMGDAHGDQPLSGQKGTCFQNCRRREDRTRCPRPAPPCIAIFTHDEAPESRSYPRTHGTVIVKGYRVSASKPVFPQTPRVSVNVDTTACLPGTASWRLRSPHAWSHENQFYFESPKRNDCAMDRKLTRELPGQLCSQEDFSLTSLAQEGRRSC